MVWVDPLSPITDMPKDQAPIQTQPQLPPMSSYGPMLPAWNEQMMKLLVDIEIPKEYMQSDLMKKVFVWSKGILMQMQFGNYTASVQRKLIRDLQYIIFLGAQDGNEGIVAEAQLIFVANMMMLKGRSDMPDGLRERIAWIMGINKNVFSDERASRPTENKGILASFWGNR